MGILSEVKCGRCDRRYSGLRSKCPYCGARRGNKRAKRAADDGNNTWKVIIGLLLLLIMIVAVVTLVVSSLSGQEEAVDQTEEVTDPVDVNNSDDGVTEMSSEPVEPVQTEEESSEEEPLVPTEPELTLEDLIMTYSGSEIPYEGYDTDYEISMSKGETLALGYETTPADLTLEAGDVVWASDNIDSIVVLQTGEVTVVGDDSATISLTIGNLTRTCYVRIG